MRGGRRPGRPDTRRSILAAARKAFAEKGYDGTTIRGVASAAGVDPALVHHYFGTKERLFRAVVQPPLDPDAMVARVFAGGTAELPERLVAALLGAWEDPVTGPALKSLFRSAVASEGHSALIREFYTTQVVRRLVRELQARGHADRATLPLRASLVASHLVGLALARYVVRIPPLADVPTDELVALVAPAVRRYLLGELDRP